MTFVNTSDLHEQLGTAPMFRSNNNPKSVYFWNSQKNTDYESKFVLNYYVRVYIKTVYPAHTCYKLHITDLFSCDMRQAVTSR